jgi:putative ABC transport system permease protein
MRQDLRYALRALARRPTLSIIIITTLALGIGANTAIFSIVNTVLLKPLPYREPDRLVKVWERLQSRGEGANPVRPANFFDWRSRSQSFVDTAWSRDEIYNLTGEGNPESVTGYRFSANMLDVLGVQPMLGRGFLPEEDRPGGPRVVLLSHKIWQRRYAGDPGIVGRTLTMNGVSFTVIGVMPAAFAHPQGVELWTPVSLEPALLERRDVGVLRLVGRLRPNVTLAEAQREIDSIYRDLVREHPSAIAGMSARVAPFADAGDARLMLAVLFGGVGFVLLIACANVANLLLADAASRRRELSVRAALGASRWRVVRQMLLESVVLAVAGGAAGALVTWWTADALVGLFPRNISNLNLPLVEEIPVNGPVFLFALVVSVVTGLLFGSLPAWKASRADLQGGLREGGRGASAGRRTHAILVVAEVSLSIVLLAGALLMMQSFMRLQQRQLGFDADPVLTARLILPKYKYETPDRFAALTRALIDRLRALPGVDTVGVTNYLPLSGWWGTREFTIEGQQAPPPGSEMSADNRLATEDYFRAMGIRLIAGRLFDARDTESAPPVVIVNQALATRFFGGENPVGRRIVLQIGAKPTAVEVVGLIGDVKSFGLEEPTHAELFRPFWQEPWPLLGVAVRTRVSPASLSEPLRQAVWSIDRDQPVTYLLPLSALASESLAFRRVGMMLAGGFGLLALGLAAIGIYGVLNYSVSNRTREIGVRVALGATRGEIAALVLRDSAVMSGVGIAIGIATALALTRFLSGLLFEITPGDPLTYLMAGLVLAGVSLIATWLPARSATTVDPIEALRSE